MHYEYCFSTRLGTLFVKNPTITHANIGTLKYPLHSCKKLYNPDGAYRINGATITDITDTTIINFCPTFTSCLSEASGFMIGLYKSKVNSVDELFIAPFNELMAAQNKIAANIPNKGFGNTSSNNVGYAISAFGNASPYLAKKL